MSILNLVRKSAFESNDFQQCINTCHANDLIVLIDDGCYNLSHPLLAKVNCKVSVVAPHANARTITAKNNELLISMEQLVKLTFNYKSVVTWQ